MPQAPQGRHTFCSYVEGLKITQNVSIIYIFLENFGKVLRDVRLQRTTVKKTKKNFKIHLNIFFKKILKIGR